MPSSRIFSFSKNSIGLEIADSSIEVVELHKQRSRFGIVSSARVKLAAGIVEKGRIKDEKKLLTAVRKAFANAKPKPIQQHGVIFGLPESQTYLHIFETKAHNDNNLEPAIQKEAEKSIPIAKDMLHISWRKLAETKKGMRILVAATSRDVLEEWNQFFKKANITVEIFDIEILATFRGLFAQPPKNPICIVDMGSASTQISIFNQEGLQYAHSIPKAGMTFTKDIASALKISEFEAEEIKKKVGLGDPKDQTFQILLKVLEGILKEIRISLDYFTQKTEQEVQEIVLAGGSAQIKGLADYFWTNLLISTSIAQSAWIKKKTHLVYIQSIGLALRGLDEKWEKKDPSFSSTLKIKKQVKKAEKQPEIQKIPEGYSLANVTENTMIRRQKIIFVVIVVVGVISIVGAFWFRASEKAYTEAERAALSIQNTPTQDIQEPEPLDPEKIEPVENNAVEEEELYAIILQTPTGLLNVREGPGIEFEAFMEVEPEDEYVLLEEQNGWLRIKIDDETEGWVSSQYTNKVEEN